MPPVHVDASRTNRSLAAAAAGPSRRPQLEANPVLLVYRRLIDTAVTEAKKTRHGAPTDNALMQRYWIQQHRPLRTDKDEWERSFECACHFLELDVDAERKRLLAEIDDAITEAVVRHVSNVSYLRMAAVLTCAGVPMVHTRLLPSGRTAKQYALGLVSVEDYDDVAGVEYPDPPARKTPRTDRRARALPAPSPAPPRLGEGRQSRSRSKVLPGS